MANLLEVLPLLVLALVLVGTGGAEVDTVEIAVDGDRTLGELPDAMVVAGGTATVPAGEVVAGDVYVVGGTLAVAGTVEGDVTQLAGTVTVADGGTVAGTLRVYGGDQSVAAGGHVDRREDLAAAGARRSPAATAGFVALQAVVLGLAGWALGRRNPRLLANVGAAVADHPVVSGTVGLLAALSGLALLVFMAVTVILLPVSVLGLALGVATVGYAYVAVGYLVGRRLPLGSSGLATAAGVVVFVLASEALGLVPVVGDLVRLVIVVVGLGAVLTTFYGLRSFEPVVLPD